MSRKDLLWCLVISTILVLMTVKVFYDFHCVLSAL